MPTLQPSLLRYAEYVCDKPPISGIASGVIGNNTTTTSNNAFDRMAHLHKIVLNGLPTFKLTGGCGINLSFLFTETTVVLVIIIYFKMDVIRV
jgi:hypothetical protein